MNYAVMVSCTVFMAACSPKDRPAAQAGTVLRTGDVSMLVALEDKNTVVVETRAPYMPGDSVCVEYVNQWDVPKFWRLAPCPQEER